MLFPYVVSYSFRLESLSPTLSLAVGRRVLNSEGAKARSGQAGHAEKLNLRKQKGGMRCWSRGVSGFPEIPFILNSEVDLTAKNAKIAKKGS